MTSNSTTREALIEAEYRALCENDLRDARGYRRSARHFATRGDAYAPLTYHVASLALERYLVALCHFHCTEPANHNFVALMQTLERHVDFPRELSRQIRALDHRFGLCSLDTVATEKPLTPDDAAYLLSLLEGLVEWGQNCTFAGKLDEDGRRSSSVVGSL
jgi:HEPN domain-containing protein